MHPAVDFVFLFDHSSGHSKQRPDGLNEHRMNRLFGGKNAASMQNTIIEHEKGYLEPSLEFWNLVTLNHSYSPNRIRVRFG